MAAAQLSIPLTCQLPPASNTVALAVGTVNKLGGAHLKRHQHMNMHRLGDANTVRKFGCCQCTGTNTPSLKSSSASTAQRFSTRQAETAGVRVGACSSLLKARGICLAQKVAAMLAVPERDRGRGVEGADWFQPAELGKNARALGVRCGRWP